MPPISPTTLLVAGSISITLSPAALVWMIRTVAAWSVATVITEASTTESLVRMEEHSKLSRHVADALFPDRPADGRARAAVDAGLRDVQDDGAAAPAREAARPRALLRVPFDRHRLPPPAPVAWPHGLHRGGIAQEFRHGEPLRRSRCADEEPAPRHAARARGWRDRIPSGR